MTHTPGPWEIVSNFTGPYEIKAGDTRVAYVASDSKYDLDLIAAAPDLLEALVDVVSAWERGDAVDGAASIGSARAAIAKARGQSEPTPPTDPAGHWETEG